jgi:hypothetical protein
MIAQSSVGAHMHRRAAAHSQSAPRRCKADYTPGESERANAHHRTGPGDRTPGGRESQRRKPEIEKHVCGSPLHLGSFSLSRVTHRHHPAIMQRGMDRRRRTCCIARNAFYPASDRASKRRDMPMSMYSSFVCGTRHDTSLTFSLASLNGMCTLCVPLFCVGFSLMHNRARQLWS